MYMHMYINKLLLFDYVLISERLDVVQSSSFTPVYCKHVRQVFNSGFCYAQCTCMCNRIVLWTLCLLYFPHRMTLER